jgi:hypothetical protein
MTGKATGAMYNLVFSNIQHAACWWLTTVITATWEAEIRKVEVRSQPRTNKFGGPYLENTQLIQTIP